jgi:hypothetical protein
MSIKTARYEVSRKIREDKNGITVSNYAAKIYDGKLIVTNLNDLVVAHAKKQ